MFVNLNPKQTGGHDAPPPPLDISRDYSATREALAATLYDNFLSSSPAHFDIKFVTAGGTVPKLRNIVYMHVGPKIALKCDLVYKINANLVFSLSSNICLFSLSIAEIN